MNRILLVVAIMLIGLSAVNAQQYNIGIRAGLGQNTFRGVLETDEDYGLAGGFHFGFNFQWNFNEYIGLRSEIIYNQMGSSYTLDTPDGFYAFTLTETNERVIIRDSSLINLSYSNAYLQMPQTFHFKLTDKIELFAGGYAGFMISPVGSGTLQFGGNVLSKEHGFRQGLNFEYNSDDERTKRVVPSNGVLFDINRFGGSTERIALRANGQNTTVSRVENSYDFLDNRIEQSKFLSVDLGLTFGASYYLNRGLYIMGRVDYGLRDVTRNNVDFSYKEINDDGTFVFNNDSDKNLGFYLSLGFKF